jgi:enoyl-CoA hydratase/carnithine racemase
MTFQTITANGSNGFGIITLNRPDRRNAISILMRKEILKCLESWQEDDSIGCVVITGVGNAFSSGFDLEEFKQVERHDELLLSSSQYHRNLWNFPKPTIAAINGYAMGGGFDLACFCDIRIAALTATFGHPEIKFGAPPLYTPLRLIVGDGIARELCLTGRRIDASEAQRIGLVSSIYESGELSAAAEKLAMTILEAPLDALKFSKKNFAENCALSFEESFAIEHDKAFRSLILPRFAKS